MKRDRQILDAAAELFTLRGFAGVGVDEIGARVGVSGPAIYHHFPGKDAILARLFTEGLDDLLSVAGPAAGDAQPELERMVRTHVRFALDRPDLITLFQRESRSLHGTARRTVERRMRQYAAQWEDELRRRYPSAPEIDLRCGAQAAIGLIHSCVSWPPDLVDRPDIAEVLCGLVLDGLATLGGASG